MLVRRLRPYPMSIVRAFAWSELYFVIAMIVDHFTGVNYGFLLHKPEAFSLLSFLSDWRPLYLLQFHGLALLFFAILYAPFAIADLVAKRCLAPRSQRFTKVRHSAAKPLCPFVAFVRGIFLIEGLPREAS